MNRSDYQEIEMPNGTYVVENRVGSWMAWAPDEEQPFIAHPQYEMVMTFVRQDSKENYEHEQ